MSQTMWHTLFCVLLDSATSSPVGASRLHLSLVSVGTLFAVFGLLPCRPAAMGTGDVLFLLCLGLHLAVVGLLRSTSSTAPGYTVCNDCVYVVAFAHNLILLTR